MSRVPDCGRELPDTMRVARLYAWGDVRVETMPVPRPGPGQAVVRIEACGICGSDSLDWYVNRKAPVVLGHEPAGIVAAIGEDVQTVRVGDRVFVHHHAPCGDCPECERRLWSNCRVWRASRIEPGGLAEYALVPAGILKADTLRLPDTMDFDTATFIEPAACCLRALQRRGGLRTGESVHVVGLGAMGLLMTRIARLLGASVVTGADYLGPRRELAARYGADAVVDPAADDVADVVARATQGRGADLVIVCPGDPRAVLAGVDAAAPGGRVICFTPLPPDVPLTLDQSDLYFREITLTQSYSCGPDETRQSLAWLASGEIDPVPLITSVGGLGDVTAALERTLAKQGIKTIIRPGS